MDHRKVREVGASNSEGSPTEAQRTRARACFGKGQGRPGLSVGSRRDPELAGRARQHREEDRSGRCWRTRRRRGVGGCRGDAVVHQRGENTPAVGRRHRQERPDCRTTTPQTCRGGRRDSSQARRVHLVDLTRSKDVHKAANQRDRGAGSEVGGGEEGCSEGLAGEGRSVQKHFGSKAEVAGNKSRLVAISTEGKELCSRGHFASQEDLETASGKTTEKMSAKEALLLWCQRRTNGYQHVDIKDFSLSWQNGLGFNFLIHHYRPDLINFTKLNEDAHLDNLRNAFDVADKHLGIPQLFDPEDIDVSKPNEKSVLTTSPPTTTPLPR